MAVAYIPAALEDLSTFRKERANGLYGPLPFTLSNFLIGLPYLFLISVIFSVIAYWLSDFRPSAISFWTWVMWLFLDLLAAEGLVVLVTCIAPIFVVALAVTAFANGLWMCVGGFMVPLGTLNVFWKYVFHYIDYQAYVFQGMMVSHCSQPPQHSCPSLIVDIKSLRPNGIHRSMNSRTETTTAPSPPTPPPPRHNITACTPPICSTKARSEAPRC